MILHRVRPSPRPPLPPQALLQPQPQPQPVQGPTRQAASERRSGLCTHQASCELSSPGTDTASPQELPGSLWRWPARPGGPEPQA